MKQYEAKIVMWKINKLEEIIRKIKELCCGSLSKDELLTSNDLYLTDEGILSKRIMETIERGNNGN